MFCTLRPEFGPRTWLRFDKLVTIIKKILENSPQLFCVLSPIAAWFKACSLALVFSEGVCLLPRSYRLDGIEKVKEKYQPSPSLSPYIWRSGAGGGGIIGQNCQKMAENNKTMVYPPYPPGISAHVITYHSIIIISNILPRSFKK